MCRQRGGARGADQGAHEFTEHGPYCSHHVAGAVEIEKLFHTRREKRSDSAASRWLRRRRISLCVSCVCHVYVCSKSFELSRRALSARRARGLDSLALQRRDQLVRDALVADSGSDVSPFKIAGWEALHAA